jgi:hypothetical protein
MNKPTEKTYMDLWLSIAKEYNADLNPEDGIIKFKLPASDRYNNLKKDAMIQIDIANNRAKITHIN